MNKIDKLERLQKLKESGALTNEEFETEKQKILDVNNQKANKNNRVKIILIIIFLTIVLITFICLVGQNSWKGSSEQDIQNIESTTNTNISNTDTSNEAISNTSELSLDDVQSNVTFYSFKNMNEATKRVFMAGWLYITERSYEGYPNAVLNQAWIIQQDGYGRFGINYSFLKSPNSSDGTEVETVYVWVEDINDWEKIGYYYYYGQDIGWGTPMIPTKKDYTNQNTKIKVDNTAETGATYTFTLDNVKSALSEICTEKGINNFKEFTYTKKNKYNEVYESIAYIDNKPVCRISVQVHNNYVVDLSYNYTNYTTTEFAKTTGKEVYINLIQKLFDTTSSEKIVTAINKLTSNTFTFIDDLNTICTNYNDTEIFINSNSYNSYNEIKVKDQSAYKTMLKEM